LKKISFKLKLMKRTLHIEETFRALAIGLLTLLALSLNAQQGYITVDELYQDWDPSMPSYNDALDNPSGLDLVDMQVTNDDQYIYFKLRVNQELCLGNSLVNHEIWLNIDADNNPSTGFPEQTGYGTELAINLNGHYAWFNSPNPNVQVNFGEIEIQMAPTVTSRTFEIAIPRNIKPDGINALFTGDTIRIGFNDDEYNDRMPDDGTVFTYVFQNGQARANAPIDIAKYQPDDIRIVSHNILFNRGFSSNGVASLERVVKALGADIYCFQECSEDSLSIRNYFDLWLPLGGNKTWQVASDGSRVVVSRWPFSNSWNLTRKNAYLVDLPDSISRLPLLLINGHLSCCTNNAGRQYQVDEFASFILDAKIPGGQISLADSTPFVFLGDMNFVGFAQQYQTVISGDIQDSINFRRPSPLDWDDSDLGDARPLHLDSNFVYTWRDLQGDGFPPGRLDYQFFSDAVLSKQNNFILDTERMSTVALNAYNLQANDTRLIADHLPVVVDYRLRQMGIGLAEQDLESRQIIVYPNPVNGILHLDSPRDLISAMLFDLSGKKVLEINQPSKELDLSELKAGIYRLELVDKTGDLQVIKVQIKA